MQSGCPCSACGARMGEQCCFSHLHTVHRRCSTRFNTTHSHFRSALRSSFSCWCVQWPWTWSRLHTEPSCVQTPRARAFSHNGAPSELLGFLTETSLTDILSRLVWVEFRAAVNLFKKIFRWFSGLRTTGLGHVHKQELLASKESACPRKKLRKESRVQSRVRKTSGGGNGNPLLYCCLGNPLDKEAWQATVHRVAKELERT